MYCAFTHVDAVSAILGKSHYVLFNLVSAMQPRMLVTFDEELRPLPVSVRVGQVCSPFYIQSLGLTVAEFTSVRMFHRVHSTISTNILIMI